MDAEIRNAQGEKLDYSFHAAKSNSPFTVIIGHGVTANKDRPFVETFQATGGNVRAQFVLGYIYYHAKGVAEDSVQGVMWWHKAAEQGHAEAQWELGNAYVRGQGVVRDIATGYAWYSIAADNGFVFAKRDKEKIAQKMYPGDVIRAEGIAKQLLGTFSLLNKV